MNLQRGDRKPVIHRIIAVSWFFFCLTAGTVLISFAFQAERTWTETLFPCYLAVWALIFFSGRLLLGRLLKAALVKCNRTEEGRLAEAPKRAGATLNWAKDRSLSPLVHATYSSQKIAANRDAFYGRSAQAHNIAAAQTEFFKPNVKEPMSAPRGTIITVKDFFDIVPHVFLSHGAHYSFHRESADKNTFSNDYVKALQAPMLALSIRFRSGK